MQQRQHMSRSHELDQFRMLFVGQSSQLIAFGEIGHAFLILRSEPQFQDVASEQRRHAVAVILEKTSEYAEIVQLSRSSGAHASAPQGYIQYTLSTALSFMCGLVNDE